MISGEFRYWKNNPLITSNVLWYKIFEWLQININYLEIGRYNLPIEGVFVNVMKYGLKDRLEAKFESHLCTIDLQMSLENSEGIEWHPLEGLLKKGKYNRKTDFQFYETPKYVHGFINNSVGIYTILFPEDAHQPQRKVNEFKEVKKLVVKIPKNLFDQYYENI